MFDFQLISRCTSEHNTSRRYNDIMFLAVHYTAGSSGAAGKAKDNAQYYAYATEQASADFFVDAGGVVQYNAAPLKRYCWAVGGTSTPDKSQGGAKWWNKAHNSNTISIELCSDYRGTMPDDVQPNDPHYMISSPVFHVGADLAAYLLLEYNISAAHLIRHFDVTGKLCPGVRGWNDPAGTEKWEDFKTEVSRRQTILAREPERFNAYYQVPDWGRPTIAKLCDAGFLQGGGAVFDVNGRPADLDLSMDMLRLLVIQDRAGLFDGGGAK